jgi:quercetin dioxygenase-like cupin family protein
LILEQTIQNVAKLRGGFCIKRFGGGPDTARREGNKRMSDWVIRRAEETETKWFNGDIYRLALTAEDTGGAIGMVDATIPPGGGPPPHLHRNSDEHYLVVEGELEFQLGPQKVTLARSDSLHIPRGTLHGFRNVSIQPARMILLFSPGGPEGIFSAAGDVPVPGTQVQPWGPERITPELLAQAERYDTFVPPHPEA